MLRTRMFLNLMMFVAIIVAFGLYATVLFTQNTSRLDATVTDNYRAVVATQKMRLALSRMEDGVLQAMQENKALGTAIFDRSRKEFEGYLEQQLKNGNTPQEREYNRRLNEDYQIFAKTGADILRESDPEVQEKAFKEKLEASLPAVDKALEQIRMVNDSAIQSTTQSVETVKWNVIQMMIIGVGVALVLALYAGYKLTRSVLGPIQALTHATQELGQGKLDEPVPVTSKDELGTLAKSFNQMAGQLQAYQRNTAEKITRLNRTVDATLDSFPDPIFVLDREGGIEMMNVAATELAKALELTNELPEHVQETARKVLAEGRSFLPHSFKEVVSFRLNGEEKYFLPRVLAMHNEENALIGVSVVLYDVTRFRLLDDAKTNLVSTVSHEIRTPLTSVRMVLHLLLEKTIGVLSPRQNELLLAAKDDSERLLRILNDLLDLTRLEAGNTDLNREETAPAEMVQQISEMMRETAAAKNVTLNCRVEPDLPEVMVDRQRINHVFTNLINNAIKYSPPGGEIVLEAVRLGDREVQFSVFDKGPGVPEDHQDRIFDRFYRVPNQKKTGAGLGLSIAREIVVAHGGRIGVRNGTSRGCEFYFVLGGDETEARS